MMGVGFFGQGSSSTLSPLAPPFTVDRSVLKPKLAPTHHDHEDPYEFAPRPSPDNWLLLHPPTSISDSFTHPNSGTAPIQTNYGYIGSSQRTQLPSLTHTTHTFPYDQQSEKVVSSLAEAEPYYPKYSIHGNTASLVTSLDASTQNSLTEFSYTPKWTSPWSGTLNGEHGKRKEVNEASSCEELKGKAIIPSYGNPIHQRGAAAESFMTCDETSGVWPGKYSGTIARKGHIGSTGIISGLKDAKCLSVSEENACVPYFDMSGTSVFAQGSVLQEMPCSWLPDTGSNQKDWNPFNLNSISYDRNFMQLDSCTTDPKVPYQDHSSLGQRFISPASGAGLLLGSMSKNVDSSGQPVNTTNINGVSAGHVSCNVEEASSQLNTKIKDGYVTTERVGIDMKKGDHIVLGSSPTKENMSLGQKPLIEDHLNYSPKMESKLKVTALNIPSAFTFIPGTAGQGDSVQSSSKLLDQCDLSVDSPCWKGAPASQYSPFGFQEAAPPVASIKQLEDLYQHNQMHSFNLDNAEVVSSPKLYGSMVYHRSGRVEDPSSICPKEKPSVVSLSCSEPKRKGSECLKEEDTATSTGKDPWTISKSATQDGSSDFFPQIGKPVSRASSSGVGFSTDVNEFLGASDKSNDLSLPKIDVQLLVKMIHNLSELLLCSHCDNLNSLKEQDYEILQLTIKNIDSCLLKKVGLRRAMPKSFPELDGSSSFRKSIDSHKLSAIGRSLNPGIVAEDGKAHSWSPSKKVSPLLTFSSASGDMDFENANGIVQAVKRVLKENICDQGENLHQTLLYKNLWIESEAALCAKKYELQLLQMKFDMEKYKKDQGKSQDSDGSPDATRKSVNVDKIDMKGTGGNTDNMSAPNAEERPSEVIPVLDDDLGGSHPRRPWEMNQSSLKDQSGDVESSVLARYRILRSRINSQSSREVEQQLPDTIDVGVNLGVDETVSTPNCEIKPDVGSSDQQMAIAGLGFRDGRKLWPFIRDVLEDGDMESGNRSEFHYDGTNCIDEVGLDVSEKPETTREFLVKIVGGSKIQPQIPGRLGSRLSAGESDSPSSDWEHVLKEELKW